MRQQENTSFILSLILVCIYSYDFDAAKINVEVVVSIDNILLLSSPTLDVCAIHL